MGGFVAGAGDPDDPGLGPSVEDGGVLRHRDAARRLVERRQIGIDRPPVGVEQLLAGDRERRSQLDQRQDAPLARLQARGGRVDVGHPSKVGRRVVPTEGAGEIDELAGGEGGYESLLALAVEPAPAGIGDRGVGTQQMVHRDSPLRLPIPNEPLVSSALGPPAAASTSISVTGSAVNR